MGSGKTTIGRRIGPRLGLRFIDLDEELQQRLGVAVSTVFDIEGETGFRQRERQLLDELTRQPGIVLATGGGSVLDAANRDALAARGLVVYLKTSVDQQLRRLERDKQRPLLQAEDRHERLRKLARERDPIYHELADLIIQTENLPPSVMAERIAGQIEARLAACGHHAADDRDRQ